MEQKLVKLSDSHYVVVDVSEVNKLGDLKGSFRLGDGILDKIITHSTIPLDFDYVKPLNLLAVEEAISGFSLIDKSQEVADLLYDEDLFKNKALKGLLSSAFKLGFKAHQDFIRDKFVLSIEDVNSIVFSSCSAAKGGTSFSDLLDEVIKHYSPKTEWAVCFDELGRLRLV